MNAYAKAPIKEGLIFLFSWPWQVPVTNCNNDAKIMSLRSYMEICKCSKRLNCLSVPSKKWQSITQDTTVQNCHQLSIKFILVSVFRIPQIVSLWFVLNEVLFLFLIHCKFKIVIRNRFENVVVSSVVSLLPPTGRTGIRGDKEAKYTTNLQAAKENVESHPAVININAH